MNAPEVHKMRRNDKEITEPAEIESVLRRAQVCRLALADGDQPYVVPLCFGYEGGALYFHSARDGKKLEILRKNPNVCFEVEVDQELVRSEQACGWTMRYRSVIGFGTASEVDGREKKKAALGVIMRHYAEGPFDFPDSGIDAIVVLAVAVRSITGKKSRMQF